MSDAVALFHPARREALLPFLDLDEDENEDSAGIYAEELEDGLFLLFTFQPFAMFAQSPEVAQTWLAALGDEIGEMNDDPRGILFFPDTVEPDAQTYAEVVSEVGDEGLFIVPGASPTIDMDALHAIAAQLLGGMPDGSGAPSPFELGKMLEGVQQQLLESFGNAAAAQDHDAEADESEEAESGTPPASEPSKT